MSSQKRQRQRKERNLLRLEPLFKRVKVALMHDLADADLRRLYCMKERGEEVQDVNIGCPPYVFKKIQQLLHFDKRVIWTTDKPFEELAKAGYSAFKESQVGFNCPEPMSQRAMLVIQKAAELCANILGDFSYDDWFDSCSFGKRAAVGLPRSKSYLDTRFNEISGTEMQWAAFREMLSRDVHLLRAVRKRQRTKKIVDTIKAVAVPKSWKSARIMAPDSILGGLLSRGLGALLRRKLERNTHIDLAKQQERHRRWAMQASVSGLYSTIDMSKASDSFVWRHIQLLVPSDWHHALDAVRTDMILIPGEKDPMSTNSYMLMGSGHTFPLQTLLFYCLAEATRLLLKSRGRVSVYGDDIIVPTRCSIPFIAVMSELGFTINSEKSFYDEPDKERPTHTFFRESCGGDYKGGIDVRPYMPECDLQCNGQVPKNEYVAWCHKMVNGLLDHWDVEEVQYTVLLLLTEINNMKRRVCFVPEWEVDHAGIKHYIPPYLTLGLECSRVTYKRSIPVYYRLVFAMKKRKRNTDERPYLWYSYWVMRNRPHITTRDFRLFLKLESRSKDLYSPPIQLSGETLKSEAGVFRWVTTEVGDKKLGNGR